MQPTTWNPSDKSADITLSGGNLIATETALTYNWNSVRSSFGIAAGKWYWEVTISGTTQQYWQVGVGDSGVGLEVEIGSDADGYAYRQDGYKMNNNSWPAYGDTYTAGDIISVALDLDNGKIWWAKNGVWQASGDPATGTNEAFSGISGTFFAMAGIYRGDAQTANFGASAFTHTVPTGFNPGFGSVYNVTVTNPSMIAEGLTGIYSAQLIPMPEAEGFTGIIAEPSIPMIRGAGTLSDNMTHIESSVIIPSMTAEVTQAEQIWGAVTAPMMTAELTERETVLGNVEIPMMTAALSSGLHAELDASVPMMTAEGLFSGQCKATAPMMTVEIEGFVGRVVNSNITVPMITAELTGQTESLVNCDVSIPMSLALAEITVGKVIVGDVTIPMMTTRVSTYEEITGDINTSIPMMEPYMIGTVDRFDCSTILRYVEPI